MALCCDISSSKGKLIGYNLLCWFIGCLLIMQGFWLVLDVTKIHILQLLSPGFAKHLVLSLSYGFFILGCGMLSVAVLGFCYSLQTSKLMTILSRLFSAIRTSYSVASSKISMAISARKVSSGDLGGDFSIRDRYKDRRRRDRSRSRDRRRRNRDRSKPKYLFKLSILVTIEVLLIVAILVYQSSVLTDLKSRLSMALATNYGHKNNSNVNDYGDNVFTQSMDFTQYTFNCCGITSDGDYINARWRNVSLASNEPRNVPLTCCVISDNDGMNSGSPTRVVQRVFHGTVEELWQHPQPKNEQECQTRNNGLHQARYKQGCLPFLENWLDTECIFLIKIMASLVVIQMFGLWFSIIICRRIYNTA